MATTDLPVLAGVPGEALHKDAFLHALDFVCHDEPAAAQVVGSHARTRCALSQRWRADHPLPKGERETLAYERTSGLSFGVTGPIAERGHNADRPARPQVNVGVVVSRRDRAPLGHFVYPGSRSGSGTSRNLPVELQWAEIPPGLLIDDRGILSHRMAGEARGMGWHLLGGLSKSPKEVRGIRRTVEVPRRPTTYVRGTRRGAVYATKVRARVGKEEREEVVYTNAERATEDEKERNRELSAIGEAVTALSEQGKAGKEAKRHGALAKIVGSRKDLGEVRVQRGGTTPRILGSYRGRAIRAAAGEDGRRVRPGTDETLPAKAVVEEYLGKEFAEKVFRTRKTPAELEPVRHRWERRGRVYRFVGMLAHRLVAALRYRLEAAGVTEKAAEYPERLLEELGRVERTEVMLGGQRRTWYLNRTDFIEEALKKLGRRDLRPEGASEGPPTDSRRGGSGHPAAPADPARG